MSSLSIYAKNYFSANGEDGIIAEILHRLHLKRGTAIEFGAWDGKFGSNTCHLVKSNQWSAIYIEGDKERFKSLKITAREYRPRLTIFNQYVKIRGPFSLTNLLATTTISPQFEILSIDIDSYDYWIWHSMQTYRPFIVIIEVNSSIWPFRYYVHPAHSKPSDYPFSQGDGSSFRATCELGRAKGYTLVCHTGNCIFVRNDLVHLLNLPWHERLFPILLFRWDWINNPIFRIFRQLTQLVGRSKHKT